MIFYFPMYKKQRMEKVHIALYMSLFLLVVTALVIGSIALGQTTSQRSDIADNTDAINALIAQNQQLVLDMSEIGPEVVRLSAQVNSPLISYEPTMYAGGVAGDMTILNHVCSYYSLGDIVYVNIFIHYDKGATQGTGELRLGGLPFQSAVNEGSNLSVTQRGLDFTGATSGVVARVPVESDYIVFRQQNEDGTFSTLLSQNAFNAEQTGDIYINGWYVAQITNV